MGIADLKPEATPDAEPTAEGNSLSKDVIFAVLKNRRRRDVLKYLQSTDGTATLSELAEQIAAWENDVDVSALNSTQRKRVYVALYQTHLPRMDDAGIVEYDSDRGTVSLSENADLLRLYLGDGFAIEDPWYRRYAALSLLGAGLLAASFITGTELFAFGTMAAVSIVALFLAVSVVHTYNRRQQRRTLDAVLDRIE